MCDRASRPSISVRLLVPPALFLLEGDQVEAPAAGGEPLEIGDHLRASQWIQGAVVGEIERVHAGVKVAPTIRPRYSPVAPKCLRPISLARLERSEIGLP